MIPGQTGRTLRTLGRKSTHRWKISSSTFQYQASMPITPAACLETNTDIFRVKLPITKNLELWVTVKGKIIDKTTGKPIGAKIVYERLPDGKDVGIAQSNPETGEYEIRLPAGQLYGVRAESPEKCQKARTWTLRNIKL